MQPDHRKGTKADEGTKRAKRRLQIVQSLFEPHYRRSSLHYIIVREDCNQFLTTISLLAVAVSFVNDTCSERMVYRFILMFALSFYAIALTAITLGFAAIFDIWRCWKGDDRAALVEKDERGMSIAILVTAGLGWLLFAGLAPSVAVLTSIDGRRVVFAACTSCPEGFGSQDGSTKICRKFLE